MSEMRTLKLRIFSRELDKFGSLIEHLVILSLLSFSALEAVPKSRSCQQHNRLSSTRTREWCGPDEDHQHNQHS